MTTPINGCKDLSIETKNSLNLSENLFIEKSPDLNTHYYADAEQSALEIRTTFFFFLFFFFSSWQSQIVTQVDIGYTYIVANGSSCCFFLTGVKVGFVIMEGFMR